MPKKSPGARYSTASYGYAIRKACARANVPEWAPNQLRHARLTEVRRAFGLEAAQVIGGHAHADVTHVYAERDEAKAMEVVSKIGYFVNRTK